MAKKVSNQIVFTEQKKIIQIKEWYLATDVNSGVTTDKSIWNWTEEVQTMDGVNKYLWNYEEIFYSIGEPDISNPAVIGVYATNGISLEVKYILSDTPPVIENNDVSLWSDTIPIPEAGKKVYMTQKLTIDENWSIPLQISAEDGVNPVIEIIDGYWYINGESTGIEATGPEPTITIGENGNWFIDNIDSGTKAQGETGRDGACIEYVYYQSSEELPDLAAPSYIDDVLTEGWSISPQGITQEIKYEYVSVRNKPMGGEWGDFSSPVIWSRWGERGQDGDGIEYKYYLSNSAEKPTYSVDSTGWTDEPQGVSIENQYEYVVQIKIVNGEAIPSEVALWSNFSEDGIGVDNIENWYATSPTVAMPDIEDKTLWKNNPSDAGILSSANKFLWKYEVVKYTDGSSVATDPVVVGVFNDSGENTVTFRIYSKNGYEFSDSITSISLQVAAFQGSGAITEASADFSWYWLNEETQEYIAISEEVDGELVEVKSAHLEVQRSDDYALHNLKCVMTYLDRQYEDYIILTDKVDIYSANISFLNGNNYIVGGENYIIAQAVLYKNGVEIDKALSDKYYVGTSKILSDGVTINTDIEDDESIEVNNNDYVYFVIEDNSQYSIVLGQYIVEEGNQYGLWKVVPESSDYGSGEDHYSYIYDNNLTEENTKTILIPKNSINKNANLEFEIYYQGYNQTKRIASTSAMLFDLNDPIVSDVAPPNPKEGQLWINLATNELKVYSSESGWESFNKLNGGAVYTSMPTSYEAGDLWVVSVDETDVWSDQTIVYGAGTVLKAIKSNKSNTLVPTDWRDAMESVTTTVKNVKESFSFSSDGLQISKRVEKDNGNIQNPFYVQIDSQKMGFHSRFYDEDTNNVIQDIEVVHIGNNSAEIMNPIFVGNDIKIRKEKDGPGFVWKIESDGSISLMTLNSKEGDTI